MKHELLISSSKCGWEDTDAVTVSKKRLTRKTWDKWSDVEEEVVTVKGTRAERTFNEI